MKKYRGRHRVGKGTYWRLDDGQRVIIETEGILPGAPSSEYIKVHSIVMLAVGHLMGVLYVLFLPVVSIAMLAALVGRKMSGGVLAMTGKGISFGWKPGMAYLSGRKKKSR